MLRYSGLAGFRTCEVKENRKSMKKTHPPEDIDQCIAMLKELMNDTEELANLPETQRMALLKAAGAISRPDRAEAKKRNKAAKKPQRLGFEYTGARNDGIRRHAGCRIRRLRRSQTAPQGRQKKKSCKRRNCYVQGRVHDAALFYDTLQEVRRPELSKAFQTASRKARSLDHRRSQDRLSGSAFDAVRRRHGHRDDPVPADAAARYAGEEGLRKGRQVAYSRLTCGIFRALNLHQLCEQQHGRLIS
jgi:hypothetical protein